MSTEREYLESIGVISLQSAARMAGLKWKNGDPAFTKSGIIDALMRYDSIRRATIAALQRMDAPKAPKSFADDWGDEFESAPPAPKLEAPAPTPIPAQTAPFDVAPLRQSIDSALRAISELRTSDAEQSRTLRNQADSLHTLALAVSELQTQRPIEFHFPDRATITVDPKAHHASYPKLVKYLQINRRVILTGSAGTGKSLAVKNAAEALGVKFYLLPPVTMSHELIGHRDAQGLFHDTPLTLAYKHGGLCLVDEADASLPDALLCANPIFDGNGFATFGDGVLHEQHPDFYAVFNMNTDGNGATMQYAGRNRLDGATLARFGVRIHWDIDPRIETAMALDNHKWHSAVKSVRALMLKREIVDVNATPRHVKTGAALLQAGCDRAEVLRDVLQSGALQGIWNDILALPEVSSFLRS